MTTHIWFVIIKVSYHPNDKTPNGIPISTFRQCFSNCPKALAHIQHSLSVLQAGFGLPEYFMSVDDVSSLIGGHRFYLSSTSDKVAMKEWSWDIYHFDICLNYLPLDISLVATEEHINNVIKEDIGRVSDELEKQALSKN